MLGRLAAELEYGELEDTSGATVTAQLSELLVGIHRAGDALTKTFFSSRAVPVAAIATQEAQQQQCG